MPRGPSQSPYTRSQRIERSFAMFGKGYRDVDVMRMLKISRDTVRRYRAQYETHIQSAVTENPRMLTDVLGNTIRVIEEIDLVRKDAWDRLDDDKRKRQHRCSECGCHVRLLTSEATALQKVILDTSDKRMKLFGLLGVKQEYFMHVQKVLLVQNRIIEFLQTELCDEDRRKFDAFMARELPAAPDGTILDVPSEEIPIGA